MIVDFIKNKFTKDKKQDTIQVSKYFPDKFYTNKHVTFDGDILFRTALLDFPSEPQFVSNIRQWTVDGTEFEEIDFLGGDYKVVYDTSSKVFYLLSLQEIVKGAELSLNDYLEKDEKKYDSWFGLIQIDSDRLLKIFIRNLNDSSDEYIFIMTTKDKTESIWASVILLPGQIA